MSTMINQISRIIEIIGNENIREIYETKKYIVVKLQQYLGDKYFEIIKKIMREFNLNENHIKGTRIMIPKPTS